MLATPDYSNKKKLLTFLQPLSWGLFFWSCLWEGLAVLLLLCAWIPGLAPKARLRLLKPRQLRTLAALRKQQPRALLFFCSSAGEYEQALPLIEKLETEGAALSLVVFFSSSGFHFARARAEPRPYLLAPGDSLWQWRRLLRVLRPSACFVVRHELWPGFLAAVRPVCPLYLVNASSHQGACNQRASASESSQALASAQTPGPRVRGRGVRLKSKLLQNFSRIYVVSENDRKAFLHAYALPADKLHVSGDTKYDRVFQRALLNRSSCQHYQSLLEAQAPGASRLIVGSAWPADVAVALKALQRLQAPAALVEPGCSLSLPLPFLQVVIALHVPSQSQLAAVIESCKALSLTYELLSSLPGSQGGQAPAQVVIADRMGVLAELYGSCHLALVGGALHHQVHNVLEPACYALPLAFGPLYKNSGEACLLVQAGAVKVLEQGLDQAQQLALWWAEQLTTQYQDGKKVLAVAQRYIGASEAITLDLKARQQDLWQ